MSMVTLADNIERSKGIYEITKPSKKRAYLRVTLIRLMLEYNKSARFIVFNISNWW